MRRVTTSMLLGLMILLLFRFDSFYMIENALSDKLTMQTRTVDPRIKIVAIDSQSLDKIGRWPWPRDIIADVINNLASHGATAVWPDILFTEPSEQPLQDQALAEVVEEHDNVYLPVYFEFKPVQKTGFEYDYEHLKYPVVDIVVDRIGHINIIPDNDNVVRRILLGIPTLEDQIIPIIDVRLTNLLLPEQDKVRWKDNGNWYRGQERISLDRTSQVGFSYASSAIDSKFDIIPIWKIIEEEIDPAYFENTVVIIGPYTVGLQDQYLTPMGKTPMFGVEIHANIIQAILDDKLYTKVGETTGAFLVALLGMLGFILFEVVRARWGIALFAIFITGYSVIVYYVYHAHSILLPYFYVILALLLGYICSTILQYLQERKERNRITSIFGRYVSNAIVTEILSNPKEIELGGVRKDVTVMFIDIRGFTPLSEQMEPEEIIKILNEYLDLCTKVLFKYQGTIDKFIGDGVMSIFGAPIAQDDHAERAVRTALEIINNYESLAQSIQQKYGAKVSLGIGIHSGFAVIGNIGSHDRLDYTAIGDTVNVAARLESNAKPGQILISSNTRMRIGEGFSCTKLEAMTVKGKKDAIQVYQVDSLAGRLDVQSNS